jgi:hypothetical protein
MVIVISLNDCGHFTTAGTAPRGPEVDEGILVLGNIIADLDNVTIRSRKRNIDILRTLSGFRSSGVVNVFSYILGRSVATFIAGANG